MCALVFCYNCIIVCPNQFPFLFFWWRKSSHGYKSLGFHSPRGYLFKGGDASSAKVLVAFVLAPTSSQTIVVYKPFILWICLFFGWIFLVDFQFNLNLELSLDFLKLIFIQSLHLSINGFLDMVMKKDNGNNPTV